MVQWLKKICIEKEENVQGRRNLSSSRPAWNQVLPDDAVAETAKEAEPPKQKAAVFEHGDLYQLWWLNI